MREKIRESQAMGERKKIQFQLRLKWNKESMRWRDTWRLFQMASPTDVKPFAPPASATREWPLAFRWAVEVGRRIQWICLCSGMGKREEPPPELHVLETKNNSGEKEAVTFFRLSDKPCLVVSPEVILSLFSYLTFSCGHLFCFGNVCVKRLTKC